MAMQTLTVTRYFLLVTIVLASGTIDADEATYVPTDVPDAVQHLIATLDPDSLREARRELEDDFAVGQHFGLGLWMRNNWGLWGESRLAAYFKKLGIHHPDDMSAIVLHSLWRQLNDLPINLESQVQCYKDWWTEQQRLEEQYGDNTGVPMPNFSCPNREIIWDKLPDKPVQHPG